MKLKNLHLRIAMLSILALMTGCTSFDSASHFSHGNWRTSNHNKQIEYVKQLQHKFDRIDAAHNLLVGNQARKILYPHSAVVFNTTARLTSSGIDIDLSVHESPKLFYASGKYTVLDKKAIAVLVSWVRNTLAVLHEEAGKEQRISGVTPTINGVIVGSSDGLPTKFGGVPYRGEFGRINIPAIAATLNGKESAFNIWPGKGLSNAELSAVRASGIASILTEELKSVGIISVTYDIRTTLSKGQPHRFSQIYFQLEKGRN